MQLFFFLTFFLQTLVADVFVESPILHGTLDNGMCYYIQENSYPKGRAYLQLTVKVGSLNEEEHEQGVAHFLEHLNFRGSEHFEDGEIDRYLESLGDRRRNGATSFDQTTYHFDIPVIKEGSLDKALLFIRDFFGFATFDEAVVEKERHVVLDEIHQRHSSPVRRRWWQLMRDSFPGSLLVKRFPSGTFEVINNVSAKIIRSFYKKWYRPDRMALMVVGDIDGQALEEKIEKLFSPLVNPDEVIEEPELGVVFPKRERHAIYSDPELDETGLYLVFSAPLENGDFIPLKEQIKKQVQNRCLIKLISNRLKNKNNFYFRSIQKEYILSVETYLVSLNLFEGDVKKGLCTLLEEMSDLKECGFNEEELQSWKEGEKKRESFHMTRLGKRSHESLIAPFMHHFLFQNKLLTESEKYPLWMETVEEMTLDDLNESFANSLFAQPFTAFLYTPNQEVLEAMEGNNFLSMENLVPKALKIEPGTIEKVKGEDRSGVMEWSLSNGLKVFLKHSDLEEDKIYLSFAARGGLSQFSEEDLPSACFADLGLKDLEDLGAMIETSLGYRSIDYVADEESLEKIFQALYKQFKEPKFDTDLIKREIYFSDLKKGLKKSPEHAFKDFVAQITSNGHYSLQAIDPSKADPEKVKETHLTLFGNPSGFDLVIVGDFDLKRVEALVKKYIASLPVKKQKEQSLPILPTLQEGSGERDFVLGKQTFVTTLLNFGLDLGPTYQQYKSLIPARGLVELLNRRLWKVLRTDLGKTYGVYANLETPFYPDFEFANLKVEFTCQAKDRQLLAALVLHEVEKLLYCPSSPTDLQGLKAFFAEERREGLESNTYRLNSIKFSQLRGADLASLFDLGKIDRLITADTLQELAIELFTTPNYTIFYHLPE